MLIVNVLFVPGQVQIVKAWEYGLATQLRSVLGTVLKVNEARAVAEEYCTQQSQGEHNPIDTAANEAVVLLKFHDTRTLRAYSVENQSDPEGGGRMAMCGMF